MSMWSIWVIVAIVFAVAELFTPAFFFFWFAIGALIAAITSIFIDSLTANILIFTLSSFILWLSTRKIVKKLYKTSTNKKTYQDSLEGLTAIIIKKDKESLYVKVGGEEWKAISDDFELLNENDKVVIIEKNSNILKVKKL